MKLDVRRGLDEMDPDQNNPWEMGYDTTRIQPANVNSNMGQPLTENVRSNQTLTRQWGICSWTKVKSWLEGQPCALRPVRSTRTWTYHPVIGKISARLHSHAWISTDTHSGEFQGASGGNFVTPQIHCAQYSWLGTLFREVFPSNHLAQPTNENTECCSPFSTVRYKIGHCSSNAASLCNNLKQETTIKCIMYMSYADTIMFNLMIPLSVTSLCYNVSDGGRNFTCTTYQWLYLHLRCYYILI